MEKGKIHPTKASSGSSATTAVETTVPETALNLASLTEITTTSKATRTQPIAVPQGLPISTVDVVLKAEAVAMNPAAMGETKSPDPGAVLHHLTAMKPCAVRGRPTSGVLSAVYGTQLTIPHPIKGCQLVVCKPV